MMPDPSPRPFSWSARGQSFRYAFRGLRVIIATQHNARLHLLASIAVIFAGLLFQISRLEWIALVIAMGTVLSAEALNTAIERLGDALTREAHPLIRDAKDMSAAGVLLASLMALIVGLIVFVPYAFTMLVLSGVAG